MSDTSLKKVNMGNLRSVLPKYRAESKLLQYGRHNSAIRNEKPAEILKLNEFF